MRIAGSLVGGFPAGTRGGSALVAGETDGVEADSPDDVQRGHGPTGAR